MAMLPSMLVWDREDRETDLTLVQKLITYSNTIRQASLQSSFESKLVTEALQDAVVKRDAMVEEVMAVEGSFTQDAIDAEIAYSRTFKVDAARIMLDILVKIRSQVLDSMLKVQMKKFFRSVLDQ